MVEAAHELLGAWESYYVILGSSAAALTGLQFVVVALIADRPTASAADGIGAFGTPTVFHFCQCLFVAVVLSAPWPGMAPVIALLATAGMTGLVYTLIVSRRARRQTAYRPVLEDWIWHAILPLLAYLVLLFAALLLHAVPVVALFFIAAAVLALVFIGIHNAWDSVAFIATQGRGPAP